MTNTLPMSIAQIEYELQSHGQVLLRNPNTSLSTFNHLMGELCTEITFDPARGFSSDKSQKVDAGISSVGLHIENGNTPQPPSIVAFFSQQSASHGSQTTWCDGVELYKLLPPRLQQRFGQPIVVKRQVPEQLWKNYVATALKLDDPHRIKPEQLQALLSNIPNQSASFDAERNCHYQLSIDPIRPAGSNGLLAFANALLGPSFNYDKPECLHSNGEPVSQSDLDEIAEIAEHCTHEHQWQDGDILILDNARVMHGRREISVPLSERQLFIGMGMRP